MRHSIVQFLCICWLLAILPTTASSEAKKHDFRKASFTSYAINLDEDDLRLFWKDANGKRFGNVATLERWATQENLRIKFATNAGIFDSWFAPSGLHIENHKTLKPLNLDTGRGNFFLKPNGVFFVDDTGAKIVQSEHFKASEDIRLATQSGPLLLIDGQPHPAFREKSSNKRVRSGVGLKSSKEVVFAISNQPVRFHDFAMFFREKLGCNNALYLDGFISKMHIPAAKRPALKGNFAGIFAVLTRRQSNEKLLSEKTQPEGE